MLDGDIDYYRKVVATDLDGTFYCARAAGRVWRRQKEEGTDMYGRILEQYRYGSFIATASMSGHIVNIPQLQAAYNGAKAGIIHLGDHLYQCVRAGVSADIAPVRSLAVEWVRFARANTVSPGYMATEMSDFIPIETKNIWRDKIPMGYVPCCSSFAPVNTCLDGREKCMSSREPFSTWPRMRRATPQALI